MRRRAMLRVTGASLAGGLAGCLGGQPETYLEATKDRDPDVYPYPVHGQRLPAATLSAPLRDETIDLRGFDDRDVVLTFFYSHCQTVCPRLISALRNVQTAAAEDGHTDDLALVAVTFDPARDTADRLREYADLMNVDRSLGNWYFLRPESPERAKTVVQDRYGVVFEKVPASETDMDMAMFNHFALIVLANKQGNVERPYTGGNPDWQRIYDDFSQLRSMEG